MTDRLILEVLDGRAQVRARTRVDALPATIGRGLDNTVVLDDPYVCPTHVRIERTNAGELVAQDTGSVNGLYLADDGARVTEVPLRHGTRLRIGRTIVRYHDPLEPMPPTLVDGAHAAGTPSGTSTPGWFDFAWLGTARARTAVILGSLVFLVLVQYSGVIERSPMVKAVGQGIGVLLVLVIWSGIWALATRVVSQRFAFSRHLAFASLMTVASVIYGTIVQWMDFFAPGGTLSMLFSIPAALAIGVVLFDGHLGIAAAMPRTQRLRTSIAVTAGITAIVLLFAVVGDQEFSTKMDYAGQLKPVPARYIPAQSLDQFTAHARSLRAEVDGMKPDTAGAR